MTTESEARDLLARAADTIDVAEGAPTRLTGLPEPPHRRWPLLVAVAAAVVMFVGTGVVVADWFGGDSAEPATGEPVERAYEFDNDQVPSVLGMTEAEAVALLQSRGWQTSAQRLSACAPKGIAVGTSPAPGTRLQPGHPVKLTVSGGERARCGSKRLAEVWELIRFARGLGDLPATVGELDLWAGGGEPQRITAAQAHDPTRWTLCEDGVCHSALAALEQVVTTPQQVTANGERRYLHTYVAAHESLCVGCAPQVVAQCERLLTPDPWESPVGDRFSAPTFIWVDFPKDFMQLCPPAPLVQLEWDRDGRIAAVGLRLASEVSGDSTPEREVDSIRRATAEAFVAWARREAPAPSFADEVSALVADEVWLGGPLTAAEAEERDNWALCSGVPTASCRANPLAVIAEHDGPVVKTGARSSYCVEPQGELPDGLAEAIDVDLVRLDQPEPKSCRDAWAVELWINDAGEIHAVNLAASR